MLLLIVMTHLFELDLNTTLVSVHVIKSNCTIPALIHLNTTLVSVHD